MTKGSFRLSIVTAAAVLAVAGCTSSGSGSGTTTPATTATSSASGSAEATPSAATGSSVTAEQLAPVVAEYASEHNLPGAVVLYSAQGSDPVLVTEGLADRKSKTPMSAEDTFVIASVTKSFVGTVALQLVDEGKLALDDPISTWLPDFPNAENITIRQLIDMTSGIADYSYDPALLKRLGKNPAATFTREEIVDVAAATEPYFPPGEGLRYSNSNTFLLGLIIEKVTGNTLESEVTTRIIEPLGLTHTTFPTDAASGGPTTTGYQLDPETGKLVSPPLLDPSFLWAAGAMVSNAEDLAVWARALATGELVSPQLQAERVKFQPLSLNGAPEFFTQMYPGYGLAMERYSKDDAFIGHSGRSTAYNAQMFYHPADGAVLVTLANTDTVSGYGPLFFATVAREAFPGAFPDLDPSATAVASATASQ